MTTPEFEEYRNPGGFKTNAFVLTEPGEYNLVGYSGAVTLPAGAVLIETPRPGQYDTVSAKDWDDMDMSPVNAPVVTDPGFSSPVVADDTAEDDE